jgi:hypothetical protein
MVAIMVEIMEEMMVEVMVERRKEDDLKRLRRTPMWAGEC